MGVEGVNSLDYSVNSSNDTLLYTIFCSSIAHGFHATQFYKM